MKRKAGQCGSNIPSMKTQTAPVCEWVARYANGSTWQNKLTLNQRGFLQLVLPLNFVEAMYHFNNWYVSSFLLLLAVCWRPNVPVVGQIDCWQCKELIFKGHFSKVILKYLFWNAINKTNVEPEGIRRHFTGQSRPPLISSPITPLLLFHLLTHRN